MNKKNIVVSFLTICVMISFIKCVNAEECYLGADGQSVCFPDNETSFADEVVDFDHGTYVEPPYDNPLNTLNTPDCGSGGGISSTALSLGNGGTVILKFTDNSLTTSGDDGDDLWIFECGSGIETTYVYISNDGDNWISVGNADGATDGIDIDAYVSNGVVVGEKYNYVKLIDNYDNDYFTGPYAGADIDAVGAISSADPLDTDNDGIYDHEDNCPYRYNPAQTDRNGNGVGDTCDTDTQDNDGDGVDNRIDNCEDALNFYQLDADNDTIGDVCDDTPGCGGSTCGGSQPDCEPTR